VGDGQGLKPKSYDEIIQDMVGSFSDAAPTISDIDLAAAFDNIARNMGQPSRFYVDQATFNQWSKGFIIRPVPNLREKDKPAYDFCRVAEKLGLLKEKQVDQAGIDARNVYRRFWRNRKDELPFWRKR